MATVPLSGTNVRLLSGVPFYNDYKDTRWFDTKAAQTAYFLNRACPKSMQQVTFQRFEDKTYIAVSAPIDDLRTVNYLMFQNAKTYDKWFYAFVTKLEYKNSGTTYVHFQLDVLQTWRFDYGFKPSFVLREHTPLWYADGTPVRNTVPEQLNYGEAYDVVWREKYQPYAGLKFLVLISNSVLHPSTADDFTSGDIVGGKVGVPQPLSYYVVPFFTNGMPIYYDANFSTPISTPEEVFRSLYTSPQSVNQIVSAYVADFTGLEFTVTPNSGNNGAVVNFDGAAQQVTWEFWSDGATGNVTLYYVKEAKKFVTLKKQILADKYDVLEPVGESKLLMYPYTVGLLTDYKGNQYEFRLEDITNNYLTVLMRGSLGTSSKTMFALADYNNTAMIGNEVEEAIQPTAMDHALIDNDPHDIAVVTDYLAAYMQGHKNSIQANRNNIVFNGTMNTLSGVAGIAGSLASPVGTAAGVATGVVNTIQGAGNAVLQLQSINAQIKDISNIPPSIAKMGGNIAFDYGNEYDGYHIVIKQIKPEYQKKLSDFWHAYGYKVNELKVPNFHTRLSWNYVQTLNCRILADLNNEDLAELKAIFDNGITLWHTDDIGNYDLLNGGI